MEREDMEFGKKISENMSAAFDADQLIVSEELIQKTLQRIKTDSEQSKKAKRRKTYNYIGIFTGLAAACLVLFIGFRVFTEDSMAKSESARDVLMSGDSNMMPMKSTEVKADYKTEEIVAAEEPEAYDGSVYEGVYADADTEYNSSYETYDEEMTDIEYTVYELEEPEDADLILSFRSLIDNWPMEQIDILPETVIDDEREMNWIGEIWITEGDTVTLYSYNNSDLMYRIVYAQEDTETYYKVSDLNGLTEKIAELLE